MKIKEKLFALLTSNLLEELVLKRIHDIYLCD